MRSRCESLIACTAAEMWLSRETYDATEAESLNSRSLVRARALRSPATLAVDATDGGARGVADARAVLGPAVEALDGRRGVRLDVDADDESALPFVGVVPVVLAADAEADADADAAADAEAEVGRGAPPAALAAPRPERVEALAIEATLGTV